MNKSSPSRTLNPPQKTLVISDIFFRATLNPFKDYCDIVQDWCILKNDWSIIVFHLKWRTFRNFPVTSTNSWRPRKTRHSALKNLCSEDLHIQQTALNNPLSNNMKTLCVCVNVAAIKAEGCSIDKDTHTDTHIHQSSVLWSQHLPGADAANYAVIAYWANTHTHTLDTK